VSELAGEVFGSKKVKDCDEISLCHFEGRVYFAILQLDEKIKKKLSITRGESQSISRSKTITTSANISKQQG